MKKINKHLLLSFLFFLCFTFFINAQHKEKTGKIYFLRSTGISGSGSAFKMFIDDKFVCKLNNKKYSVHEVSVGKHNCFIRGGRKKLGESAKKFEIQIEAGKITYVKLIYETGIFEYYLYFKEVTEEIALKEIEKMSEDTKCF